MGTTSFISLLELAIGSGPAKRAAVINTQTAAIERLVIDRFMTACLRLAECEVKMDRPRVCFQPSGPAAEILFVSPLGNGRPPDTFGPRNRTQALRQRRTLRRRTFGTR